MLELGGAEPERGETYFVGERKVGRVVCAPVGGARDRRHAGDVVHEEGAAACLCHALEAVTPLRTFAFRRPNAFVMSGRAPERQVGAADVRLEGDTMTAFAAVGARS